jgi:hypothetical protein
MNTLGAECLKFFHHVESIRRYNQRDWPSERECREEWGDRPPQWSEYPTVFLSPENKGFE